MDYSKGTTTVDEKLFNRCILRYGLKSNVFKTNIEIFDGVHLVGYKQGGVYVINKAYLNDEKEF